MNGVRETRNKATCIAKLICKIMPLTQKTKTILQDILKFLGISLSIITVGLFIVGMILWSINEKKQRIEEKSHVDNIIRENKDSMSAFMSVIVEANQTLVNNPRYCRWLLLGELTQPCYISKSYDGSLIYEKPSREKILIWIPTDSMTWTRTKNGKSIELKYPLYIGNNIYNGDLNRLKMIVIDKKDRGF